MDPKRQRAFAQLTYAARDNAEEYQRLDGTAHPSRCAEIRRRGRWRRGGSRADAGDWLSQRVAARQVTSFMKMRERTAPASKGPLRVITRIPMTCWAMRQMKIGASPPARCMATN